MDKVQLFSNSAPSHLVDQMWHQHILDVTNYCHDMMLLCGHVVGHNPDGALDYGGKKIRDTNTHRGLEDLFRGSYDKEIWGIQSNADTVNAAGNQSEASSNTISAEDNSLTIIVKDQSGEETFYKIKPTTQMGKIFRAYASRKGIDSSSLRFTLDGVVIEDYETPLTLELEDQDQLDAISRTAWLLNPRLIPYHRLQAVCTSWHRLYVNTATCN